MNERRETVSERVFEGANQCCGALAHWCTARPAASIVHNDMVHQ